MQKDILRDNADAATGASTTRPGEVIPYPYSTHETDTSRRAAAGQFHKAGTGSGGAPEATQPRRLGQAGLDGEQLGGDPGIAPVCGAAAPGMGGGRDSSTHQEAGAAVGAHALRLGAPLVVLIWQIWLLEPDESVVHSFGSDKPKALPPPPWRKSRAIPYQDCNVSTGDREQPNPQVCTKIARAGCRRSLFKRSDPIISRLKSKFLYGEVLQHRTVGCLDFPQIAPIGDIPKSKIAIGCHHERHRKRLRWIERLTWSDRQPWGEV